MPAKPIFNPIRRIGSNEHVGWSLYAEDYPRAVKKLAAIYRKNIGCSPTGAVADFMHDSAVEHLAALGITAPKAPKKRR